MLLPILGTPNLCEKDTGVAPGTAQSGSGFSPGVSWLLTRALVDASVQFIERWKALKLLKPLAERRAY
jgi:hypothetical protein